MGSRYHNATAKPRVVKANELAARAKLRAEIKAECEVSLLGIRLDDEERMTYRDRIRYAKGAHPIKGDPNLLSDHDRRCLGVNRYYRRKAI